MADAAQDAVDIYDVLEQVIRWRVKMESALRRIEIMAGGGAYKIGEIERIAHEGLQPPKEE